MKIESISTLITIGICLFLYITIVLVARQILINKSKSVYSVVIGVLAYLIIFVGTIIVLNIWGIDLYPFLIAAGIIAFVIGLSMQDILKDLINGIKIISLKTYKDGDIISIDGFKGTVVSVTLVYTTILNDKGITKTINNRFISEVMNYSNNLNVGFVDLNLSFEEDIDYVTRLIADNVSSINEDYPQIIEGPNVLGLVDIERTQKLRVSFKSKCEDIELIERSLRKYLIRLCINNNIKLYVKGESDD